MTNTAQETVAGLYCGNCGTGCRPYWTSCPTCEAPLSVAPASEYVPQPPTYVAEPSSAPPPNYPTAPVYAPTPVAAMAPPAVTPLLAVAAPPEATVTPRSNRSRASWLAVVVVLAVLLVGAGGYAAYGVTRLSATRSTLRATTSQLASANRALTKATNQVTGLQSSLDLAQSADSTDNTQLAQDNSQLAQYHTCFNDLNALGNAVDGSAAEAAALRQAETDCTPLGLAS